MVKRSELACPRCRGESFKVTSTANPKSNRDFIGAVCVGCGYTLTEEDIERQFLAFAGNLIEEEEEEKKKAN